VDILQGQADVVGLGYVQCIFSYFHACRDSVYEGCESIDNIITGEKVSSWGPTRLVV
jgi:hypothetical protein